MFISDRGDETMDSIQRDPPGEWYAWYYIIWRPSCTVPDGARTHAETDPATL